MNTSANLYNIIKVNLKEKRIAAQEIMAKEGLASEEETYNNDRIDHGMDLISWRFCHFF